MVSEDFEGPNYRSLAISVQNKQQQAANPLSSGWVWASAGTGKTKVLVDRLLRVLLGGAAPETIVCLTFTNAAAFEMKERLLKVLQRWAICKDHDLIESLTALGHEPTELTQQKARSLFMSVLDNPHPIHIGTIHAFCQKLLFQFPLEAGISPQFTLMDQEESLRLLEEAQKDVLEQQTSTIESDLAILSSLFSFDQFSSFLKDAQQSQQDFLALIQRHPCLETYESFLYKLFQVNEGGVDMSCLEQAAHALLKSTGKGDKEKGAEILENMQNEKDLFSIFLTKEGTPRKRLCSQEFCKSFPHEAQSLIDMADVFEEKQVALSNKQIIESTCAFLRLFFHISDKYAQKKDQRCALDFQDMILLSKNLLSGCEKGWVFHKLDAKIHHLLLDEAQDTSPLQWQLISLLVDNMLSATPEKKSFFVVGDQKQSIYSFQGARPDLFEELHKEFREKFKGLNLPWFDINLDVSFRSTGAILKGVDETFWRYSEGVYKTKESHVPFRQNQPGLVQLLPLVPKKEREDGTLSTPWPIPKAYEQSITPAYQLAEQIACHIQSLLKTQVVLPSTKKPVTAGDVMVLVRKRGPFVNQLIQALKHKQVPVAGLDRLDLKNHLAVQDLLAFGRFLCLPNDDYSLACILKSPLIQKGHGFSEEQLFDICYNRPHSLWDALWQRKDETSIYQEAYDFLNTFLGQVDYDPPHTLYARLLHLTKPYFVARFGEECLDVLEEFQNTLLNFSQNNTPTLQGFLNFMEEQSHVVKRDGEAKNTVRILTIHGSKGLQAPVVILADSTDAPSMRYENFLWFIHKKEPLFLLKPRLAFETPQTQELKSNVFNALREEHQRLFYVALTRAQDQIYLGGFENKHEESWYQKLYTSLEQHWTCTADGGYIYEPIAFEHGVAVEQHALKLKEVPSWVSTPFTATQVDRPVVEKNTEAMKRGTLIHKFLEFLSGTAKERRLEVAKTWANKNGLEDHVIQTALSILDNPDYKILFGENSLSEVSLIHQGQLKRIDRLAFVENSIYFVDFKTHKKIPPSQDHVSKDIMDQISSYEAALRSIYKKEHIRAFLLWTEGPFLMEISFRT